MREAVHRQIESWGLGFALAGGGGDSATFGHDGSTAGFTARLVMFADGRRGLAVMTNGESEALIDEIQRSVAAVYGWPGRLRPVRTAVQLAPEKLDRLTGRYRIVVGDRTIDVAFTVAGDRLAFVGQSGRPAPLYAESPSRFFSRESGTTFTFDSLGASEARAVTIDQPGQQFVAQRLPTVSSLASSVVSHHPPAFHHDAHALERRDVACDEGQRGEDLDETDGVHRTLRGAPPGLEPGLS